MSDGISAEAETAPGLSMLDASVASHLNVGIRASIAHWASAALGIDIQDHHSITCAAITHRFLKDVRELKTQHDVIWETLEAESFFLTASSMAAAGLQGSAGASSAADMLARGIASDQGSSVSIDVVTFDGSRYLLRADRPVVFAYRLARVTFTLESAHAIISLADPAIGLLQNGPSGYTFLLATAADPITRQCTALVSNPSAPKFAPVNACFAAGRSWESPVREVVHLQDRRQRPDFVWDNLRIEWETDLRTCRLALDRQNIFVLRR